MARLVSVGGERIGDPVCVISVYQPSPSLVSSAEWDCVQDEVRAAVGRAEHGSARAALFAVRYTAQLTVWALRQDVPLDMGRILVPSMIDHFVATVLANLSMSSKSSVRSHLRRVARAQSLTWSPAVKFPRPSTLSGPYPPGILAAYWQAAHAQATARRQRVFKTVLTLGGGAGLQASEILSVSAVENVRQHPHDDRLWVIVLPDRTVPVRIDYAHALADLCEQYPAGRLIGRVSRKVNDPMGAMLEGIELPAHLPPLRCRRLRITWMARVLNADVRISEFRRVSGTVSAKSLEGLAPHIPVRDDASEYLFKAAGIDAEA